MWPASLDLAVASAISKGRITGLLVSVNEGDGRERGHVGQNADAVRVGFFEDSWRIVAGFLRALVLASPRNPASGQPAKRPDGRETAPSPSSDGSGL